MAAFERQSLGALSSQCAQLGINFGGGIYAQSARRIRSRSRIRSRIRARSLVARAGATATDGRARSRGRGLELDRVSVFGGTGRAPDSVGAVLVKLGTGV
jgi:hypothetical protein